MILIHLKWINCILRYGLFLKMCFSNLRFKILFLMSTLHSLLIHSYSEMHIKKCTHERNAPIFHFLQQKESISWFRTALLNISLVNYSKMLFSNINTSKEITKILLLMENQWKVNMLRTEERHWSKIVKIYQKAKTCREKLDFRYKDITH